MGLLLWLLLILAVPAFALPGGRKALHAVSVAVSALSLILGGVLTGNVIGHGKVEYGLLGGIFYLDALGVLILDIVLVIGFMAAVFSIGYLEEEVRHGKIEERSVRLYYILMYTFLFTMVFALSVRNMGVMWIAIEATTLASAFLVGFYNDKRAIEATWKYVIICSVGIAVAMLGIIFLHMSSVGLFKGSQLLDWTALYGSAAALKSPVLRLAFVFILVGFGTKAGLAPMHTWLPDAHSQAPSPISALLSGVLLNSAMYAIIRTVAIVNKNLGDSLFTGRILMAFGLLSILTAAIFIITQKDYKRLLAYSSIEHMGIIAFAVGVFSPAAVFGAIYHMINHSFTKSMLFLTSGSILQKYGTREIAKVRGLLKVLPVTGTAFFLGLFAIAGTPPFSVFASEFNILAAAFEKGNFFIGAVLAVLLAIVFAGIALVLFGMFYKKGDQEIVKEGVAAAGHTGNLAVAAGPTGDSAANNTAGHADNRAAGPAGDQPQAPDQGPSMVPVEKGETNKAGAVIILVLLAVILVMGVYMPEPLKALITSAQQIITGG
jgi:hydrogenase-4 component F